MKYNYINTASILFIAISILMLPLHSFAQERKIVGKDTLLYFGTMRYGAMAGAGRVISSANEIDKNTTQFKTGLSGGIYFQRPITRKMFLYLNLLVTQRGYNINYSIERDNSRYHTVTQVKGFQKMIYLDKGKFLGYEVTPSLSFMLGICSSLRLNAKYKFDAKVDLYDLKTNEYVRSVESSYSQGGSDAIDIFDFSYAAAIRWRALESLSVSVRFMRDFAAINISSVDFAKNNFINSGFFLYAEYDLYRNRYYEKTSINEGY